MMTKTSRVIDMGEGKTLVNVTLEDEIISDTEEDIRLRRAAFLADFAWQPQLWSCETAIFDKLEMLHDGLKWVIKLTATIRREIAI